MRHALVLFLSAIGALAAPRGLRPPTPRSQAPCHKIQFDFPAGTNSNTSRADAVRQAYLRSWDEYAQYAFGYDELLPVTHQPNTEYPDWGLTIVDGLDTAIVMGLTDVVDRMLAHIATVDFSHSHQLPDVFDTNIRWIGGLLSAHDLITNNKAPNTSHYDTNHTAALLQGALTLGNLLKPLFNTPSGLPTYQINTTTGEAINGPFPYTDPLTNVTYTAVTNTAVAGTLILEFHRLSDLTGDESLRQLADHAESHLVNPVPTPIYPNLVGSELNLETGEFFAFDAGWQSGIDSFYEYLIKSAIYNPEAATADAYRDFWITAVDSTEQHLASHPYGHEELTFITQLNASGSPMYYMDDYACFAGGNFLLGGAFLNRPDFIGLGLAVTDSCHATFNSTASGLNPLTFAWYGPSNELGADSAQLSPNITFYNEHGFFVNNGLYTLYPEPIESMFYAWRITGDAVWQEHAWSVFEALLRDGDRSPDVSMSCLTDVTQPLGGGQFNTLPSYYFAETLKYFYLIFSDPNLVRVDEFVFNTEGHPLRVQAADCTGTSWQM